MIGLFILITFVVLKLTHVINWSWWWVLSPLWIGFVLDIIFHVVGGIGLGVISSINWFKERRERKRMAHLEDALESTQKVMGISHVERRPISNTLGTASLAVAIFGIFWGTAVLGIIAIALGVIQWRRHISKRSIAGFIIGIIDIILAVYWYITGQMPLLF